MTEFEVERIKQAFDVLEGLAVERYDSIVDRCDNPKAALSCLRSYVSVLTEVKNLLDSYCLLTPGEPQTEEGLKDPTKDHAYRFKVQYKACVPEEYSDWEYDKRCVQIGTTPESAKVSLASHIEFENCNDKTFRDLQIELIDQFY